MKARVIKKQTMEDYVARHAASRAGFETWATLTKMADWEKPQDIVATFGTADILGSGCKRVVFNIKGNDYRMICKYAFGITMVRLFICWIGTHTEYDEICERNEQYTIHAY